MKKYLLVILSILTVIALLPLKATAGFAVADEDKISTGIFLPTSYLQYYKLDDPYAICRYTDESDNEVVAISHKNEIVIYRNEKFSKIDVSSITNGNPIAVVAKYKDYILFLYASKIYSIDIADFESDGWANVPVDTGIFSAMGFSVNGDVLLTNDTNGIRFNTIDSDAETFKLKQTDDGINVMKTVNILYSENGNVYYSTDIGDICKYDTASGETETLRKEETGIRSIAESGDGKIYYSCNTGIYCIGEDKSITTIAIKADDETDKDLGKIYDPKGICLTGKGLWVVDAAINAVQEIDLTDNSFTKFAITTNSKAINRLSATVKDLSIDGDKIYALDGDRIVVINDIEGVNTYNCIYLGKEPEHFAAGGGYLCLYSAGAVELYKISGEEEILEVKRVYSTDKSPITDVTYMGGKFYLLSEEQSHGNYYPVIYETDINQEIYSLVKSDSESTPEGRATQIVADVFGNIYYAAENGGNYEFYKFGDPTLIRSRANDVKLKNLQTDMDGKLYALYQDGLVECYQGGEELFAKTLKLSQNLDGVDKDAVSMCLSYNSNTAYFLYKGLILKSSNEEDMAISTPRKIAVPSGFALSYGENDVFGRLKGSSITFTVEPIFDGEYFAYTGITEFSGEDDYEIFYLNDKYALLITNGTRAIARIEDINAESLITIAAAEEKYGYAAVDFKVYSVPVTESYYSGNGAKKHEKIEILGELDFNGESFYAVKTSGGNGYIPQSFIISSIAKENEFESARSTYIYLKDGVKVWSDESLQKELKTLSKKTKVKVVSQSEEILKIDLDGEIGFVSKDAEYSDDRNNTVKALAVILCALSITVFALFFENKYLYRNKR